MYLKKKRSSGSTCMSRIKAVDIFKRPFYFLMPDKTEYYRSVLGTIFSFVTILIIMVNGSFKFADMVS